MKILIVDDDRLKIEKIINTLNANLRIDEIEKKYSYQSGLKEILSEKYDLILLDMSMPTFDITCRDSGGQVKALAGKDIMRYMNRKNVKMPVIVITQYDTLGEGGIRLSEITSELEQKYNEFYLGSVYYDVTIENWKNELLQIIKENIIQGEVL